MVSIFDGRNKAFMETQDISLMQGSDVAIPEKRIYEKSCVASAKTKRDMPLLREVQRKAGHETGLSSRETVECHQIKRQC